MVAILLQPVGSVKTNLVTRLKGMLESALGALRFQASSEGLPLPSAAYNEKRNQYVSEEILKLLRRLVVKSSFDKVLGILDVDIYVPGFNFIFGQAESPGRAALISLTRLRPEFYGCEGDEALFYERTLKEAVHELGHTFGLSHCNRQCVMRFSNSIYDTDRKPVLFCSKCMVKMTEAII